MIDLAANVIGLYLRTTKQPAPNKGSTTSYRAKRRGKKFDIGLAKVTKSGLMTSYIVLSPCKALYVYRSYHPQQASGIAAAQVVVQGSAY
jgi:hypothetical protein